MEGLIAFIIYEVTSCLVIAISSYLAGKLANENAFYVIGGFLIMLIILATAVAWLV